MRHAQWPQSPGRNVASLSCMIRSRCSRFHVLMRRRSKRDVLAALVALHEYSNTQLTRRLRAWHHIPQRSRLAALLHRQSYVYTKHCPETAWPLRQRCISAFWSSASLQAGASFMAKPQKSSKQKLVMPAGPRTIPLCSHTHCFLVSLRSY